MAPFQTIQETTNKEDDSRFNGYHVIVGRMPGEENLDEDMDDDDGYASAFERGIETITNTYNPDEEFRIDRDCDAFYEIYDEMDNEVKDGSLTQGTYRLHNGRLQENENGRWVDLFSTQY